VSDVKIEGQNLKWQCPTENHFLNYTRLQHMAVTFFYGKEVNGMALAEIKEFDHKVKLEIGQRIQKERLSKDMSGVDVAAYLGIGKNQLSRIENGKANCTVPQLFILSQLLGCSVDFLLFGTPSQRYSQEQVDSIKSLLEAFSKNSL
jgi:plasmid maintenance system antidote protein VapI